MCLDICLVSTTVLRTGGASVKILLSLEDFLSVSGETDKTAENELSSSVDKNMLGNRMY